MLPTALPALFSATLSPALSVYLCANVGPRGLPVVRLPAPFVPHSASLVPATATQILSTPVPISAPPTSLDECLFFISLVSVLLAVGFSVLVVRGRAVCLPTPPSWFDQGFLYGCQCVHCPNLHCTLIKNPFFKLSSVTLFEPVILLPLKLSL